MIRILTPAMNAINPDLKFTAEIREDFMDNKLPTLDCKLWFQEDWSINHTYYEKEMRSQILIPERSAMSQRQKMSILGNELVRRLTNMNAEKNDEEERRRIVDHFTSQLKTSGYERRQAREVIISGIKGWLRKRERRQKLGQDFYRGAASTLKQRMRKKLLDPVNWYKTRREDPKTEEDDEEEKGPQSRRRKRKERDEEPEIEKSKKLRQEDPKTVLFIPYTNGSELAKLLRDAELDMEKTTGYKVKVVEESGEKIKDILHTANPWKGEDCGREKCLLCRTKQITGKGLKSDCSKRSIVYETWCETCLRAEMDKIDLEDMEEEEKERKKRGIKIYKYVGESARSAFERGLEHQVDLERLEEDSHMLKHISSVHRDKKLCEVEFGMKVVKFTRSALERQVLESVKIQEERAKNIILNSKSEYSRCTIPRLTSKMGEVEYDKQREAEKKEEQEQEMILKQEIKRRKKDNCKDRGKELHEGGDMIENNKQKRRKTDQDTYKTVIQPMAMTRDSKRVEEEVEKVAEVVKKKPRKEEVPPGRFLGGILKDMELVVEVDWQKRRQEILERMEQEERTRIQRMERAKKLQKSWELSRECRKILQEMNHNWISLEDRIEEKRESEKREIQVEKATRKGKEYKEKQLIKAKNMKITDMFSSIPKTEARRIEEEVRKEEGIPRDEGKLVEEVEGEE